MVLYVSPYVNHKIKYSKETTWLKLENTSIRIFVVIYMYIWNLIITVPCCFPVNCIVLKVVEHSYSMLYQHSNITESGEGGDMPNWTILRKYEASLYYLHVFNISSYKKSIFYIKKSIPFLDIRTSFFDLKKSISWYQKIDSWYQEIELIFLYQEIGLIFFISSIFFFISRNGSFL